MKKSKKDKNGCSAHSFPALRGPLPCPLAEPEFLRRAVSASFGVRRLDAAFLRRGLTRRNFKSSDKSLSNKAASSRRTPKGIAKAMPKKLGHCEETRKGPHEVGEGVHRAADSIEAFHKL